MVCHDGGENERGCPGGGGSEGAVPVVEGVRGGLSQWWRERGGCRGGGGSKGAVRVVEGARGAVVVAERARGLSRWWRE